jgi:hypothetical protein
VNWLVLDPCTHAIAAVGKRTPNQPTAVITVSNAPDTEREDWGERPRGGQVRFDLN